MNIQPSSRSCLRGLLCAALFTVYPAAAGVLTVTHLADSGPGSLRQAILDAVSGDQITFDSSLSGVLVLTTGELHISNDLEIAGPGAEVLAVSGGGSSRVFRITQDAQVAISGLTIRDGRTPNKPQAPEFQAGENADPGGGILNQGTLIMRDCVIRDNRTGNGGNTPQSGNLYTWGGKGGNGGGVFNDGSLGNAMLWLERCRIQANQTGNGGLSTVAMGGSGGDGGGVASNGGNVTMVDCVVANNLTGFGRAGGGVGFWSPPVRGAGGGSGGHGGGVRFVRQMNMGNWFGTGKLSLLRCTFHGNATGHGGRGGDSIGEPGGGGLGGDGGAVDASHLEAEHCTFVENRTGQGGRGGDALENFGHYYFRGGYGGNGGNGGAIGVTSGYTTGHLTACAITRNQTGNGGNSGWGAQERHDGRGGNGGGLMGGGGNLSIRNCVIAQNTLGLDGANVPWSHAGGVDVGGGSPQSLGYNLLGSSKVDWNDNWIYVPGTGDQWGSDDERLDPLLSDLGDHGGPTPTCLPLPGSPLLDSGDASLAGSFDQRGHKRQAGAGVDIGAVELGSTPPSSLELWRYGYFGTTLAVGDAADDASPAGDGISNLMKYAFDLDPQVSETGRLPQWSRLPGGEFVMDFLPPASAQGIRYEAEWSTTLQPDEWFPIPETGTAPWHSFAMPSAGLERMFVRLKVRVE